MRKLIKKGIAGMLLACLLVFLVSPAFAVADEDDDPQALVDEGYNYGECINGMREVNHWGQFADGTGFAETGMEPCDVPPPEICVDAVDGQGNPCGFCYPEGTSPDDLDQLFQQYCPADPPPPQQICVDAVDEEGNPCGFCYAEGISPDELDQLYQQYCSVEPPPAGPPPATPPQTPNPSPSPNTSPKLQGSKLPNTGSEAALYVGIALVVAATAFTARKLVTRKGS